MKNIKWNEYTWYSRLAAIVFFIAVLPMWTFYLGMQYEKTRVALMTPVIQPAISIQKVAARDEYECYSEEDPTIQYTSFTCASIKFEKVNKELNDVYGALQAELDEITRNALTSAQRKWIDFRDAECTAQSASYEGGTIQPSVEIFCKADLTQKRVEELKKWNQI